MPFVPLCLERNHVLSADKINQWNASLNTDSARMGRTSSNPNGINEERWKGDKVPLVIQNVGRDNSKEYFVNPDDCLSTHGAAGWPIGVKQIGATKYICPICGTIVQHTRMTDEEYRGSKESVNK